MISKKDAEGQLDQAKRDIADAEKQIEQLQTEQEHISGASIEDMGKAREAGNRRRKIQQEIEDLTSYKADRESRLEKLTDILWRHRARAEVAEYVRNIKRSRELFVQRNNRLREASRLSTEIEELLAKTGVNGQYRDTHYYKQVIADGFLIPTYDRTWLRVPLERMLAKLPEGYENE